MNIQTIQDPQSLNNAFLLVKKVFNEFVAPDYSPEGVSTFFSLVTPEYLVSLQHKNGFVCAAYENSTMVGMLAIRDRDHITLFFVDKEFQGKGVGRALYQEAKQIMKSNGIAKVDVHSSPFAKKHYEALGFKAVSKAQIEKGIVYVPMEMVI
jgi:GNAT superfamily N-acetyltransferase